MSHVAQTSTSCVMSYTRASHVTHMSESCLTHTTCTRLSYCAHTGAMSDGTHINEARHTNEHVMFYTRASHVTHKRESCHTHTTCTRLSYCTDTGAMTKSLTRPLITASTNMLKSDKRGTPRVPGANLLYMSHVTSVNESCHTYKRGEARLECQHQRIVNEPVISHIWMS